MRWKVDIAFVLAPLSPARHNLSRGCVYWTGAKSAVNLCRNRNMLWSAKACAESISGAPRTTGLSAAGATTVVAALQPQPGRDFYGIPNPGDGARLMLGDLRERLIRQEETIIFALIERAQFRVNGLIYAPDGFDLPTGGYASTFLEYLLYEVEAAYAKVRRYTSPDEHAFAPHDSLPTPLLPALDYPGTLSANSINVNASILRMYIDSIVPAVCDPGDDQNYGSAATADVACLQALSKRIHYGKFIAEAKVQECPDKYACLARAGDRAAIHERLSDATVEDVLLRRVANKARNYGSDVTVEGAREVYKVQPELIARIYRDFIIPLTKEVEIDYILMRLNLHNGRWFLTCIAHNSTASTALPLLHPQFHVSAIRLGFTVNSSQRASLRRASNQPLARTERRVESSSRAQQ
eukprot:IDg4889t1